MDGGGGSPHGRSGQSKEKRKSQDWGEQNSPLGFLRKRDGAREVSSDNRRIRSEGEGVIAASNRMEKKKDEGKPSEGGGKISCVSRRERSSLPHNEGGSESARGGKRKDKYIVEKNYQEQ